MTGEFIATGDTFDIGRIAINDAFSATAEFNNVILDSGGNFSAGTGGGIIFSAGTDLYNIFASGGAGGETLAQTLALGSATSGNNISVTNGDYIGFLDGSGNFHRFISDTLTGNKTTTLPDKTGTLAHLDDITGYSGNTFTEVLTNENTTADGQTIDALNGSGQLDLRNGGDNVVSLTNDAGAFSDSGVYFSANYSALYSDAFTTVHEAGVDYVASYTPAVGIFLSEAINVTFTKQGLSLGRTAIGSLTGPTAGSGVGAILASDGSTITSASTNTVIAGGNSIGATKPDSLYTQNARLAENGGIIFSAGTNLYSIFLTSASGVGIYGGSGTIPTTTTATITDTLAMGNGTALINWNASNIFLTTDNGSFGEAWIDLDTDYASLGHGGKGIIEGWGDVASQPGGQPIIATKLNTTNNAVKGTNSPAVAAVFVNSYGGTINSGVSNAVIMAGSGGTTYTATEDGKVYMQGGLSVADGASLAENGGAVMSGNTDLYDIFSGGSGPLLWNAGSGTNAVVQINDESPNTASAEGALAIGKLNIASGVFSFAGGNQTNATGLTAVALGYLTEARGDYSLAGGKGAARDLSALGQTSFNYSEITNNFTGDGAGADNSVVLGGVDNDVKIGNDSSVIIGGNENLITNGIFAGVLGGSGHTLSTGAGGDPNYSFVIGGIDHAMQAKGSVILGGDGLTASADNTAYMQKTYIEEFLDLNPQTSLPAAATGRVFFSGNPLFRIMLCSGATAADWMILTP